MRRRSRPCRPGGRRRAHYRAAALQLGHAAQRRRLDRPPLGTCAAEAALGDGDGGNDRGGVERNGEHHRASEGSIPARVAFDTVASDPVIRSRVRWCAVRCGCGPETQSARTVSRRAQITHDSDIDTRAALIRQEGKAPCDRMSQLWQFLNARAALCEFVAVHPRLTEHIPGQCDACGPPLTEMSARRSCHHLPDARLNELCGTGGAARVRDVDCAPCHRDMAREHGVDLGMNGDVELDVAIEQSTIVADPAGEPVVPGRGVVLSGRTMTAPTLVLGSFDHAAICSARTRKRCCHSWLCIGFTSGL